VGVSPFALGGEGSDVGDFASPFESLEPETVSPGPSISRTARRADELTFSFDDDEDIGGIHESGTLMENAPPATAVTPAAPQPAATASSSGYFRYIPADIEAAPGGIALRSLVLLAGVVVLAILNVISFAYLLL